MALKANVTTEHGIHVDDAYCRVVEVSITKNYTAFTLQHLVDATKAPFFEKRVSCSYDLNGENPYIQSYNYLKTLPEFADAEDC